MLRGIVYKGSKMVKPGVATYVNTDAMTPDRLSAANTIGAIGICKGGEPNTAMRVSSMAEAIALLRGGDLKEAAEFMYDPSSEIGGAGEVVFVRVSDTETPVAQATAAIGTQLNLKSALWGSDANFTRYKIETGSVANTKKFTVENQKDGIQLSLDNLGLLFTIQYVGSENNCRMSYNQTTKILLIETSDTGAWGGEEVTLVSYDLTDGALDTLTELVATLNAHADLTAAINKYAYGEMPSYLCDTITNQDIKTAVYTVNGQTGTVFYWIGKYATDLLAEGTLGATPTGTLTNVNWTNLSGGTDGAAPSAGDWATALAVLEAESDIALLYMATSDAATLLAGEAHCTTMSNIVTGKERILICGGAAAETVDQTTERAINMNSPRSVLCYPGVKRYNYTTGNLDSIAPYKAAALVCGMAAAVTPETPLTHKTLKIQGIETKLTDTDFINLLEHGVLPIEYVREDSVYHVVSSITTWQKNDNVILSKLSGMRIHDYLRKELRNTVKPYVGQVADLMGIRSIRNAVASKLRLLTRTPQTPDGILTEVVDNGEISPSFKNLTVAYDGYDWVNISVDVFPVGEIGYITIEARMKPAKMQV